MDDFSQRNFGLTIAYVLPGFVALWGVGLFSPTVQAWLEGSPAKTPTVGGFLYVTVASLGTGLTVSLVRWAVIDTVHRWTGIADPGWDFSRLQENIAAFETLVEIHYRYYQFYANSLVALLFLYGARRAAFGVFSSGLGWTDLGFALLAGIFFAGSRDTLRKYYTRVAKLLGTAPADRSEHKPIERYRPKIRHARRVKPSLAPLGHELSQRDAE